MALRKLRVKPIGFEFNNFTIIGEPTVEEWARGRILRYPVRCECGHETTKTTADIRTTVNNDRWKCEACAHIDKAEAVTHVHREEWERTSVPAPLFGGDLARAFIGGFHAAPSHS